MSTVIPKVCLLVAVAAITVASCKKKPEDAVAEDKKHVAEINNKISDYTQRHTDDLTIRGQGAITGYYRDKEIKKMVHELYADTTRVFTEYYFDDGMLIYVHKQAFIYNKPMSYTEEQAKAAHDSVWYDDKKTRMEESSFYLSKNKLVKWIKPGKTAVSPQSPDFFEREQALWAEAAIELKQLREANN